MPQLRQTGWGGSHATWYCPVCKVKYYTEKDGSITTEKPFKWPDKKKKVENVLGSVGGAK